MEENVYYGILYDIYGSLLTDKQKYYFESYYFDNLTLDEIGENDNISKNAVSKQLKRCKELLDMYEANLKIYKRNELIKKEFENDEEVLIRISKYDTI